MRKDEPRIAVLFAIATTACGGIVGEKAAAPDASAADAASMVDAMTPEAAACAASETTCNGLCVDLQTDDANCGGCGLSCSTGCKAGRCVEMLYTLPATPTMDVRIQAFTVDSANIYAATVVDGSGGTLDAGVIFEVPADGGAVSTLASGQNDTSAIAVGGGSVYWANLGPLGMPPPVAGSVVSVPVGGGTPVTLASSLFTGTLATNSDSVVWTESQGIVRMPLEGGTPTTIAAADAGPPALVLALNETDAFWVGTAGILSTPLAGGATETIVTAETWGWSLQVDATSVYWETMPTGSDSFIAKAPLHGGATTTIVGPQGISGSFFAVDGTNVYYATQDDGQSPVTSGIAKVPVGGGTPVTLFSASGYAGFGNIVVDSTSVYFQFEQANEVIYKITPK